MKGTTRVRGVLCLLLGVLGVVMCVVGIAATWMIRGRLDNTVEKSFGYVETALTRLEDRTLEINKRIEGVHDSLHELNDRVQQRVAELRDVPTEEAADIDEIERQLYARIQLVTTWIEFMQSTVDLIQQILEMTESTSAFVKDDSRTTQDLFAALRSLRDEIGVTSTLVDEVQDGLVEIRASRNIEENAEQINTLSARIDTSLTKVQGYGQQFETGVGSARVRITDLGDRIRWRLTVIALVATLLLVWMACGQFSLAAEGRRMLRQDGSTAQIAQETQ